MSDWVFDSLICFLHSPAWNAALNTFIEEKSMIFDPNIDIDISNPQYIQTHGEYKNLVDYMLGSFMEEMNITPEQFEIACLEGKNLSALNKEDTKTDDHSFSFHKGLFQQIWAANDIRTFIKLMVQRNIEIQLQALDLIERQQSMSSKEPSIEEQDEVNTETKAEIEKAIEEETEAAATIVNNESDQFQRLNLLFEKEKIKASDVSTRQEYLRQQRDKILQIKKQARARKLSETSKERPKSARAAQKVIEGGTLEPDEASIQVRKLLARKLREEVVDKTNDED
ncbi:hypothetical protein PVAND_006429 [Polypedilum vanderplanki]|uniref:Cilia- and flagella-associated protein 36 n=1 Tax=Polypedilum vanderplanki TaxID=319348 RepID=A0A9J6C3L3_POLVA|nr:hypothetical protein PVAND_006429 [Polypedilum vanderplanki]